MGVPSDRGPVLVWDFFPRLVFHLETTRLSDPVFIGIRLSGLRRLIVGEPPSPSLGGTLGLRERSELRFAERSEAELMTT